MTFITRLLIKTFQNSPSDYFSSHRAFLSNIVQKSRLILVNPISCLITPLTYTFLSYHF